jgi:hypothetical protein
MENSALEASFLVRSRGRNDFSTDVWVIIATAAARNDIVIYAKSASEAAFL